MQRFTSRMRSGLRKLKTLFIRDGLNSPRSCGQKITAVGVGLAVISSITTTATWMIWTNVESIVNTEKNGGLKQKDDNIYDLEDLAEKRAMIMYNAEVKRSFLKHREKVDLNWDGVEIFEEKPTYTKCIYFGNYPIKHHVLFKTVVDNKSELVQLHKLKATTESYSVCKSVLYVGFTADPVDLFFRPPLKIEKSVNPFSTGFSVKSKIKSSEKKLVNYVVEDSIQVPAKSTIKVSLKTKENDHEYKFNTWVGFKGYIIGTFYNQDLQKKRIFRINIRTLILENIPNSMVKEDNGLTYIKIEGKLKFNFEGNHEVFIEPI